MVLLSGVVELEVVELELVEPAAHGRLSITGDGMTLR
jgi:hypothetical protein